MISSFSSVRKLGKSDLNKYTSAYSAALKNDPDNLSLNHSIGICYMNLGLYDKAFNSFEKVIDADPEGSFGYYAAAASLLNGRSAFLSEKKKIDKAIEYLNAAITIEERGLYHYLMAYIKYDYYKRKYLIIQPSFLHHLNNARTIGISDEDKHALFNILKVDMPNEF